MNIQNETNEDLNYFPYKTYSSYLKDKYGVKVYKLPINLPITCPNRDGTVSEGGCIFCGAEGAAFENLSNIIPVADQLKQNMDYIKKRYKAEKFIAYFQSFTNTYMDFDIFKKYIKESIIEDIVEISISTRPDCINDKILKYLFDIKREYNVNITIELGLQTINHKTLKLINRGHTLAEFIDSVIRIKKYGFEICTHLILNLPWDDMDDVIENAKILSALSIDFVKLHSLYIVKDTQLAKLYQENSINMMSKDDYINRLIRFLRYLKSDIVVERLLGRAPKENTIFVNWNTSWWKIKDEIVEKMIETKVKQGDLCDYLNGKAIKKFY
ncbi:TIGR01212 family radical SAM protein [Abyssisolibacter fermentans]|uniref:TIGR01212 family radical SAM protein n=1 Tax=Abyssisolibacter fermentans TaxID=1766203 RepID=UPI0008331023|nr:TIGR01212 family radical SAM protein [Abyssisolibacter fermentans]